MNEVNQNSFDLDNDDLEICVISPRKSPTSKSKKGNDQEKQTNSDIAKKRFLKLLVRLRRVILQDAAALIHIGWRNFVLENELFDHEEFKDFQKRIEPALKRKDVPTPPDLPPSMVHALGQYNAMYKNLHQSLQDLKNQVKSLSASIDLLNRSSQVNQHAMQSLAQFHPQHQYYPYPPPPPRLQPQPRKQTPVVQSASSSHSKTFKIQNLSGMMETKDLVKNIWENVQRYHDHVQKYQRKTVPESIKKRMSSGGRILQWILVQAMEIREENRGTMKAGIDEAIERIESEAGSMIWNFNQLHVECQKKNHTNFPEVLKMNLEEGEEEQEEEEEEQEEEEEDEEQEEDEEEEEQEEDEDEEDEDEMEEEEEE
ncbi:hypothetical protein BGX21_006723 [Mortierella sp. AD011]|nr:hypothetical protein BGX21_006723 [Mortierella sp. AD011]